MALSLATTSFSVGQGVPRIACTQVFPFLHVETFQALKGMPKESPSHSVSGKDTSGTLIPASVTLSAELPGGIEPPPNRLYENTELQTLPSRSAQRLWFYRSTTEL